MTARIWIVTAITAFTAFTAIALAAGCGGRQEPAPERSVFEPSVSCYSECMDACLSPSGFNDYGPCLASCQGKPYGPCPPFEPLAQPIGPTYEITITPDGAVDAAPAPSAVSR